MLSCWRVVRPCVLRTSSRSSHSRGIPLSCRVASSIQQPYGTSAILSRSFSRACLRSASLPRSSRLYSLKEEVRDLRVALAPLAPEGLPYEDTINVRDCWRVLVRRRALILSVVGVMTVAAVLFTLSQPAIYQSTATLMPPRASRSGLQAAFGDLGGLLPSSSLPMGLGRANPTDRLVAVLQSRTVAMDV